MQKELGMVSGRSSSCGSFKEALIAKTHLSLRRINPRYQEPVDLADLAPLPDFKLVPREKEAEVCRSTVDLSIQLLKIKSLQLKRYIRDQHLNVSRWDSLRPFSAEEDTVVEPAHFTCPPLLRLFFGIEMINMSHMLCFQNVDGAEYERER